MPDDGDPIAPISDAELAELALAAEPHDPFDPAAVPFVDGDRNGVDLLPAWYMPAPSPRRTRRRSLVLGGIVFALLVINVMGLCVTYGFPDPVWK